MNYKIKFQDNQVLTIKATSMADAINSAIYIKASYPNANLNIVSAEVVKQLELSDAQLSRFALPSNCVKYTFPDFSITPTSAYVLNKVENNKELIYCCVQEEFVSHDSCKEPLLFHNAKDALDWYVDEVEK